MGAGGGEGTKCFKKKAGREVHRSDDLEGRHICSPKLCGFVYWLIKLADQLY